MPSKRRTTIIRGILFDMDGTLLDTESLSDKAMLRAFGSALPSTVLRTPPISHHRLPWELKKQILGLRGAEWAPIALKYATEHWGVADGESYPDPYVSIVMIGTEIVRRFTSLTLSLTHTNIY
jgi:phosphoglycolate phosphatase-like HAD superfamily hydrolase